MNQLQEIWKLLFHQQYQVHPTPPFMSSGQNWANYPPKQKIVILSLAVTLKISYDSPGGVTLHGTSRCLTTKAPCSNEIASQQSTIETRRDISKSS